MAGKWWEKKKEPTTIWQACKTPDGLDYYFNTVTNETTWEKPDELMTDAEKDAAGDWQWCPDETHAFIPGKKYGEEGKYAHLQMEDGSTRRVLLSQIEPLKKSSLQRVPDDLVLLDNMSGPLILHCLKKRFEDNKIYTNVGTICISVNPYQMLPIYGRDMIEKYMFRGTEERPPHVFNIAHNAFKGMKEFNVNQSIIISGESGAGKTEATKQCLNYIAAIAGSVGGVEKKVLQANPILEAFGNAKTIRNDNSSRFGKYMELFFEPEDGRICGASTTNYLLEKIRVVQQAGNERNYHIFYQIVKCVNDSEKRRLMVNSVNDFIYLTGGGCVDVPSINDERDFQDLEAAWKELLFTPKEIADIYAIVCGVLHLGNLDMGKGENADIRDKSWAQNAAKLWEIPEAAMIKALTIRTLRIRGQAPMDVALKSHEASDTRHALGKFVYGTLFDWLVQKINSCMGSSKKSKSIGILDIFGFEIFKYNSFEQLCINYTNEMLQQHFNHQTFKLEEQIYKQERITFKHVEFIDNKPMIELITDKPHGILPLLDEELVVPRGSDKGFLGKLIERQRKNKTFKTVLKNPDEFVVKHYAGDVPYNCNGFLEKNRDTLTEDLKEAVQASTQPLLSVLFPKGGESSGRSNKSSLSKQFQQQLNTLMACLNKTEPHYIRCIKPNNDKAALQFVPKQCFEQLTYSGVFEAVSIRKQGFPFRLTHEVFAKRYNCIIGDPSYSNAKSGCEAIISGCKMSRDNTQMGTTLVLYRAEEHKKLELDRSLKVMTKEIGEKLEKICAVSVSGMSESQKEDYFGRLAAAVRTADEFRVNTPIANKARKLLDDYIEQRMDPQTKALLEEAVRTKDKATLEKALTVCAQEGYRTQLTRQCSELLEKVSDAEAALAASVAQVDDEMLTMALAMCDEFQYNSATVQQARQLLADIQQTTMEMQQAKVSMDHVVLQTALARAGQINLNTMIVNECRALYSKIMDTRTQLDAAIQSVDQSTLEAALANASSFGYQAVLVQAAMELHYRVSRINAVTDEAAGTLEEDQIRTVVTAANGIGMTTPQLEYFRNLVDGPYDSFLEAQEQKAKQLQNHDRAIRIQVKRRDILVQTKGAQFAFSSFNRLKQPMDWAKEKFFGREKRAANFLKWQKEKIHSPLLQNTIADKKQYKQMKKITRTSFETLQMFMGNKKAKQLDVKMRALLQAGISNEVLRTELYVHILKQMTDPLDPSGNGKAWEAMALCLSSFPPGSDFENYLEVWFRSPQWKSMADQWKCTGLLRRIVYHNAAQSPPNDVLNTSSAVRSRGFSEPQPPNTYDDLRQQFYSQSLQQHQADPYGNAGGGGGGGYGQQQQQQQQQYGGYGQQQQQQQQAAYQEPVQQQQAYQEPVQQQQAYQEPAAAAPANGQLPPGYTGPWQPVLDEDSGEYFYWNSETGESSWDPPF
eukprot:CAMPEP_0175127448 /NCGR_PEP_ID=MMETSP0087-20121206/4390_1 /TAXON_ID=136419 /ORGANISM="Unknown Unknown, Strain D1" /LENGTH=1428 /DNA_ID=CAMNT_0016409423 /DNA_START=43 /DNA_END=4329 /DNA_ORIENTATION=+